MRYHRLQSFSVIYKTITFQQIFSPDRFQSGKVKLLWMSKKDLNPMTFAFMIVEWRFFNLFNALFLLQIRQLFEMFYYTSQQCIFFLYYLNEL